MWYLLYYVNGTGFFALTSNGATCTPEAADTSIPSGGRKFNPSVQLQTVPGVAGEFWVSVGGVGILAVSRRIVFRIGLFDKRRSDHFARF